MHDSITKHTQQFVNQYLDDEMNQKLQSEKRKQPTLVKTICGKNFEKEVIQNPDFKECLIEVSKRECPACAFSGAVFDPFSRKLERHGYGDDLKCFRLKMENKIPQLGEFSYSPMYFYLKKDSDNQITELVTLDGPVRENGKKFLQ